MITEKLVGNVLDITYEKLPDDVLNKAKTCFIDFLAVSLKGSITPSGKIVRGLFKDGGGSTVIGQGNANTIDAPLINGVFAHSLDLDDGHRFAQLHPGCSVIPAALSLSESRDKTGKEFLSAIVAGYQFAILLGMLVNPEHRNKGFHSTGTCGTFGAAAAASKLLGFEFKETVNTIGIAGTQAAGLLESDHSGTMGKHLHAGKAAQSGVLSALLTENGFTGASSILDGKEGFVKAMVDPEGLQNIDDLLNESKYHIAEVYFKNYPVCRHLHSSVDAAIDVHNKMTENGIDADDIQSVTIKTYKIASEHSDYHPKNIESVRQSLPVSVVVGILNGELKTDHLKINEEISNILKKTVILMDGDMERSYPYNRPSEVIVNANNDLYTGKVDLPKGEPENPFNRTEILKKFNDLNPQIDMDVLDIVDDVESYTVKEIMKELNKVMCI